jgi:hypothetical protein
MRIAALWGVTGIGLFTVVFCGYYTLLDWAALNAHYVRFEKLVMSSADMRSLFIAEAQQNAFRINCFADGVGVLLGGLIAAIGIHGLCVLPRRQVWVHASPAKQPVAAER